MARQIRIQSSKKRKLEPQDLAFTVIYLPVEIGEQSGVAEEKRSKKSAGLQKNHHANSGYQVTVPLLPGLITFGRTLKEAQEMARDAIQCHIEGLKKSGEPIPNERLALKGELRIALSA